MTKASFTSLGSIAVLLLLVLAGVILSAPKSSENPETDQKTTHRSTASRERTTKPLPQEKGVFNETTSSKPHIFPAKKAQQSVSLTDPLSTPKAVKRAYTPQQEQLLRKRLALDEQALTRERLPDGTELIHLNGSQAHISAASISADGTIEVRCHNSFEGLQGAPPPPANQPSLSVK